MKPSCSITLLTAMILCLFVRCKEKAPVDLIVHNALIYTVDKDFTTEQSFAVRDGSFVEIGNSDYILENYESKDVVDLQGSFVYPGFIDSHAHFLGYGLSFRQADLTGIESFEDLIQAVVKHREDNPNQPWIIGSGWDQNRWEGKVFPTKEKLDELFPDTPILLRRIDGHAALVNQKALDMGGITASTEISGGKVILSEGKPTGVLIDHAIGLVSSNVPKPTKEEIQTALLAAQERCFAVGLTTVADAGLDREEIEIMEELHRQGTLKMRIYAMINPTGENRDHYFDKGPTQTDRLTVRSFKVFGDGALGSRGASLLSPYHDAPDELGFLLHSPEEFQQLAEELYEKGFQMNTHCIGDSANRTLLDIYGKVLKAENDRRWRIEHAQVVNGADIHKFGQYNIIPSVQPTHATSDMYWAEERLGPKRIEDAYVFKELLDQNKMIALGSDFPVEAINPLFGFHAAVARKDENNWPEDGFQIDNKLSREEALKGMTIWAAYANFEEGVKGSIEKGKLADFVVLERDIMTAPENELRNMRVKKTYVGGVEVY